MKVVCNVNECVGCNACNCICPKDAIIMRKKIDSIYAEINPNKCINCGLCHKVCQTENKVELHKTLKWYQGWSNNENIRRNSTSGGVISSIINYFLNDLHGIVYTCVMENEEFIIRGFSANDDITKVAGSKYVKSDTKKVYKEIKTKLLSQKVLLIGLPCQIAGLKLYLKNYNLDNLYLIDLICHGTPSITLLKKFLEDYGISLDKEKNLKFRDKDGYKIIFNDKNLELNGNDLYTLSFLDSLSLTTNCYNCQFATVDRCSDITVGDSWGSNLSIEEVKKGISLIMCQSNKGLKLLQNSNVCLLDVNVENAIRFNRQLNGCSTMPKNRKMFFYYLEKGLTYKNAYALTNIKKYTKYSIKKILNSVK